MLTSPDLGQAIEVTVIGGRGHWAYWQDRQERKVLADIICQPMAAHFAGRLATDWAQVKSGPALLHQSGFAPEHPRSIFDTEDDDDR